MGEKKQDSNFDPNKEAFQMRAQWAKQDNCKKQWFERWSWLLDEGKETLNEARAIRKAAETSRSLVDMKVEPLISLKPVPLTSTGVIGWLSARPDCNLEIYTSWISKIPIRKPDPWHDPNYVSSKKT